jgi:speckle-type POZ protein
MLADVFRALLHFIYTDSLPNTDDADNELIQHLLVAADRYDIGRLKLMCESMICDSLGVGSMVDTLPLAYRHNCSRLKGCCLDLINRPGVVGAVKETLAYKDLKRKFPEIIADAFEFRKSKLS